MSPETLVPDLRDIQSYLRHSGWREYPPGQAGSLWSHGENRVGVPNISAHPEVVRGVLERLAIVESIPTASMVNKIRYFRFDITKLRAANDFKIIDSIPLEAMATITNSARIMLRSSGTTSIHERGEIAGNYLSRGDKVVEEARVGHTERGSFVIPIMVKLPDLEDFEASQDTMLGLGQSYPEPFERRVMRTFAQSIDSLNALVLEPAEEPSIETLLAIVDRGVSREFCLALSRVLAEDSVSEFEAIFQWAPAVRPISQLPESVKIPSEAHDLVEKTAEKLRVHKVEPPQVFSGKIVELRHDEGDAYGYVRVSTIRNSRPVEVLVRLPVDHYGEAIVWHGESRPVLVEGQIENIFGRPLTVRNPKRCHPVDEAFLF